MNSVHLRRYGAASVVAVVCAAGAAMATPGPRVNFLFDDNPAGTTITDATGSGTSGVLAPIGAGRFDPTGGVFGGALFFDDATTKPWSGFLTFAQFTPDFSNAGATDSGSVSFFFKNNENGRREAYVATFDNNVQVELHSSNRVFAGDNAAQTFSSGQPQVNDNGWHHAVITWDNSVGAGAVKTYVDGVQVGITAATQIGFSNGTPVRLGRRFDGVPAGDPDSGVRDLNGGIDDFAVYNRVLTAGEITSIGSGGAASVASGVLSHWNLDNAAGTLASSPNAGTSNAQLYTGAPQGSGVTFSNAGPRPGLNALEFDGANELSRAVVSDSAALDSAQASGTVTLWAKVNNIPTAQNYALVKTADESLEIQIARNTGQIFVAANDDNGAWSSGNFLSATNIIASDWTHIAYCWDQATNSQMIYVDGVLVATNTTSDWDLPVFGDWVLGGDPTFPSRALNGALADFALFDRCLSPEEVLVAMNDGAGSVPAPGVASLLGVGGLCMAGRRRRK